MADSSLRKHVLQHLSPDLKATELFVWRGKLQRLLDKFPPSL
jgi:hypothetical protein